MKKRFMKILLLVLLFITSNFIVLDVEAAVFSGGDGSEKSPYQITTKEQLDEVRNYPDSNFILMNDIVFTDSDFKEGGQFYNYNGTFTYRGVTYDNYGWNPIEEYYGVFDGNNHFIHNITFSQYVDRESKNLGLFEENNGTIKKISIGLNRTDGSTVQQKNGTAYITDTVYLENNELITDVRLDNLELKYVTTEPLALIYSNDATKVSGVKIKNERVANANEKMMVAVYSNDTIPVLKGVSECEAITYGKTELSLKTPLSVSSGDKIKLFFWDMLNLLPKGYIEATK